MVAAKIEKLCIVGLGLIGGSLARAAHHFGQAHKIVGVDNDRVTLKAAGKNLDRVTARLAQGVADADLVVVATPVMSIGKIIGNMAPHLKEGAIVSDVGSVKGPVVREAEMVLSSLNPFVGAHPIAGTERSGFSASFPELFTGRLCIITPTSKTDKAALNRVSRFWQGLGARVASMDTESHDRVFAALSHLPHLAAYALLNAVRELAARDEGILKCSGGGFKDFTRIGLSDPVMWRDISIMNSKFVLDMIERFQLALGRLKSAIEKGDGDKLEREFRQAKALGAKIPKD